MIKPGINIDDADTQRVFKGVISRSKDKRKALKAIAAITRESIRRNIRVGGRPKRWTPSKRVKSGKGQTLRKTGRMMNSIASTINSDSVIVGPNTVYAATQNFGAKKGEFGTVIAKVPAHVRKNSGGNQKSGRKKTASGVVFVKAHTRKMQLPWGDIPARKFVMLQKQDIDEIESVLAGHLISGETH